MKHIFFVFTFLFLLDLRAEFKVPALTGPVVDTANVINSSDENTISEIARDLNAKGLAQLTVVTVPNLQGLAIEQAGIQIADQWKLGSKEKDQGLILLLAISEKKIRIEVGQGLEGTIPDVIAKRIIDDVMVPIIRRDGLSRGISVGVMQLASVASGEAIQRPKYSKRQMRSGSMGSLEAIVLLIIIIFMFAGSILGRIFGFRSFSRRGNGIFWGGGGGGFGGRSGGGWSGGGGGFSGGGASGGW